MQKEPWAKAQDSYLTGAPETIRTSDQRFRKPLLYPLSYGSQHYATYCIITPLSVSNKRRLSVRRSRNRRRVNHVRRKRGERLLEA